MLTGGGPGNEEERKRLVEAGWQPYSIITTREDGTKVYTSYRRLEPLGTLLGLTADFANIAGATDDEGNEEIAAAALLSLTRNLTSKTYLQGLAEFGQLIGRPDKAAAWLRQRAASHVPSIISGATSVSEDSMKDARTVMEAVKARIPILASDIRPRRDFFGQPVTPPAGFVGFNRPDGDETSDRIYKMLSPVAYNVQASDEARNELARLAYGFSQPPTTMGGLDLLKFTKDDGQDAYDRYLELTGNTSLSGKTLIAHSSAALPCMA
jgi:hypothetical protein